MSTAAKIDLFDTAEGLQKLILGFQSKSKRRLNEWGSAKELVYEIQKLIIDSERLKHQLQAILENSPDPDITIDSIQTDFVKILHKIESINQQYLAQSLSIPNSL